jgi:hypothetical protein
MTLDKTERVNKLVLGPSLPVENAGFFPPP